MLSKFIEIKDAYIFMRKFKEVCTTMRLQQLTEDTVKLRLINFTLKNSVKKQLYSLPKQSIVSWEDFVKVFLKKIFAHHKTAKFRNKINQFYQLRNESFWKYFDHFKNFLSQCPHHELRLGDYAKSSTRDYIQTPEQYQNQYVRFSS